MSKRVGLSQSGRFALGYPRHPGRCPGVRLSFPAGPDMEELFTQVGDLFVKVVTNLTNPDAWREALSAPGAVLAAFVILNLSVFTATGLLVGIFYPSDARLVTAGLVAHSVGFTAQPPRPAL